MRRAALAEIEQETSESWRMIGLPMAYHALGRKADSDAALAALIAKDEKERPTTSPTSTPSAARPTRRSSGSTRRSSTTIPASANRDGKPVRQDPHDPRWLPFLRKIGKAPEQLAKIEFKVTLPK